MLRRSLLQFAAAAIVTMPFGARAATEFVPYSAEAVRAALDQGRAVLLEFGAVW